MKSHSKNGANSAPRKIRCAIYTRKSTEEGLEKEFNSLDAQRESAEACIKSQQHEGWVCLPDAYEDGGFTGGNMERPGLRRLMADIEAGRVDAVIVYKIDRLSRSLLDFARIMELFEKHKIAFISVTQQFNTATSMGRLMMNVLLSFAQFEREIISERTRDKIAAARRKGKWSGGMPLLGYDVDPEGSKLRLNADEATRVRAIFDLYIELQSLLPVVQELERRGWTNKCWKTRKGKERGGKQFTRTSLHKLLTNVTYAGKIRYKKETHPGEHKAIIDAQRWQKVQGILQRNNLCGGALVRNKFGSLLKGLLHCVPCGCAMTPSHTTRAKGKRYRYYVCSRATKMGWNSCPSKAVPAGEMEEFVVDQIRSIGQDEDLIQQTVEQMRVHAEERIAALEAEERGLERDLKYWDDEVRNLAKQIPPGDTTSPSLARLTDLNERIRLAEHRLQTVQVERESLKQQRAAEGNLRATLRQFDPVWDALTFHEQAGLLQQLVTRVDYDGGAEKASVTFHEAGLQLMADTVADFEKEVGECLEQ
jgi:site-specific DNA recombinase